MLMKHRVQIGWSRWKMEIWDESERLRWFGRSSEEVHGCSEGGHEQRVTEEDAGVDDLHGTEASPLSERPAGLLCRDQ